MRKISKLMVCVLIITSLAFFTGCSSDTSVDNNSDVAIDEVNKEEVPVIQAITTEELQEKLEDNDWIVVDTRINDAYIGWELEGAVRGGHIKGAVDFSANWLRMEVEDRDNLLQDVLKTKGITSDKNVVLYDANGEDVSIVAEYLVQQGIENIYRYDVKEWAMDEELPMESYPNHHLVVPASWISELIENGNNGKPYKIFEVSWGDVSEDYLNGHIPGAVHINTDDVEEGPIWNRLSDSELEEFAKNYGITVDATVVLYGSDSTPAFRVATILKYMGVEDVRVLNGGFVAWENGGYETETEEREKQPVEAFGATVPVNKNYIVDLPQAKEILADQESSKLVDIRSWEEYIGTTSGYSYIEGKGRPAGAVWGHDLNNYRNIDNTMKNAAEIKSMWNEWGISSDQRLSFFCGTGWRAAEVLVYAEVMGLENISLFDGGWNEWQDDASNPIELGESN
ncbi:thiosulfate/3-mercaptopyruvate sulfurtransferase [Anaerovirgula multivorans]|uniref:Thiosulfate/3-mercaptopyruvate sulfurtransferase n=1 Tax=Anaerovirgula multivorans TaxID=312168 RepID=A0A239HRQ4_9FIRM|nr:rhodanese-like domain-containing protein [Anaerovirgula multivorans]SNS83603.1 thiosulfate/3-mercaptopyruvate sulfurtransferase [Anaerovirgula multivorans]